MTTDQTSGGATGDVVRVALGERSYDIRFLRDDIGGVAESIRPFCPERAFVISNDTIWKLHGKRLGDALTAAGVEFELGLIPDGERHKTLPNASAMLDRLVEGRFSRRSCVVAFGGGVVGDLAGFAAAVFLRGVDFVQIPTTVVAMVDSAVGGKTGVDHPLGKNLIGAFHQPRLVAVDLDLLRTLDEHNTRGGFAEIIKYGVICDADFFTFLEANIERAIALEPDALLHVVRRSCELKAWVVGQDEREGGLRAILNYGHTFAHAIENVGEYAEKQFHGQAVAVGMIAAARVANRLGMFPDEATRRILNLVRRAGLPDRVPKGMDTGLLMDRMKGDKKVAGGRVRFVLPQEIGRVTVTPDVPPEVVADVLRELGSEG